jgi:hypothetical protein
MLNYRRNTAQKLRELIERISNGTRPVIGFVSEVLENQNKYSVLPIDGEPLITNVSTFSDTFGNEPELGSLVMCYAIDDFNYYITEVLSYSKNYTTSSNNSTVRSDKKVGVQGKTIALIGDEKTPEELQNYMNGLSDTANQILLLSDKISLEGTNGIQFDGGGVKLKEILLDMLTLMGKINAAISTATPTTTGVPYAGITTDTASITTKLNTFTGN